MKYVFCGKITLQKRIISTWKTLQKCINIVECLRSKSVLRKFRKSYYNVELSIESSFEPEEENDSTNVDDD